MNEFAYRHILGHLEAAARTLVANQGDLCDGDLRIRQSINSAAAETRCKLAQLISGHPALHPSGAGPAQLGQTAGRPAPDARANQPATGAVS